MNKETREFRIWLWKEERRNTEIERYVDDLAKEEYKRGYNQCLKDEGKTGEKYQHKHLTMNKEIEEQFNNLFRAHHEECECDMCMRDMEIKRFIYETLQQERERIIGEIEKVSNKEFPLGERKWCKECVSRVKKDIIKNLKQ